MLYFLLHLTLLSLAGQVTMHSTFEALHGSLFNIKTRHLGYSFLHCPKSYLIEFITFSMLCFSFLSAYVALTTLGISIAGTLPQRPTQPVPVRTKLLENKSGSAGASGTKYFRQSIELSVIYDGC